MNDKDYQKKHIPTVEGSVSKLSNDVDSIVVSNDTFDDYSAALDDFANGVTNIHELRGMAKHLHLVIKRTSRIGCRKSMSRIGFGMCSKNQTQVEHFLGTPIKRVLFTFNMRSDGLFHPAPTNRKHVETFHRYRSILQQQPLPTGCRPSPKIWRQEDINTLVEARCEPSPPTFKNIANELNRTYERLGLPLDRPFTMDDCRNQWHSLFPSSDDANRTMEFIRHLQEVFNTCVY